MMPRRPGACGEHAQPRGNAQPGVGGGDRRVGAARPHGHHGLAQPAQRHLQGAGACRQPQVPPARRAERVRAHRRSATSPRPGADLHPRCQRARRGGRVGCTRHARGGGVEHRAGFDAATGHARRRQAAPAAHPGARLHRLAGPAYRPERQHGAYRCRSRRAGPGLAIGLTGQCHAGLGAGAPDRLFARRLARAACGRRRGRHARPAGQRRAGRVRSCCTSNRSTRRASSCPRRGRPRATSR